MWFTHIAHWYIRLITTVISLYIFELKQLILSLCCKVEVISQGDTLCVVPEPMSGERKWIEPLVYLKFK